MPVGATRNAAAPMKGPNTVPPTAATADPTMAYFAIRTSRQNAKTRTYLKDESPARVRSDAGRRSLLFGLYRYDRFLRTPFEASAFVIGVLCSCDLAIVVAVIASIVKTWNSIFC